MTNGSKLLAIVSIALGICLSPGQTQANGLTEVTLEPLAAALAWGTLIAESNEVNRVRIISSPAAISECRGTIASCPDIRLYVAVATEELYEPAVAYELPPAKGWEFIGWDKTDNGFVFFTIRTALPESDIDAQERALFVPTAYKVYPYPSKAYPLPSLR